jgi:hypothetical protein
MPPAELTTSAAFPSLPLFGGGATRSAEGVKRPLVILWLLPNDGGKPLFGFAEGQAGIIPVLQRLIYAARWILLYFAG